MKEADEISLEIELDSPNLALEEMPLEIPPDIPDMPPMEEFPSPPQELLDNSFEIEFNNFEVLPQAPISAPIPDPIPAPTPATSLMQEDPTLEIIAPSSSELSLEVDEEIPQELNPQPDRPEHSNTNQDILQAVGLKNIYQNLQHLKGENQQLQTTVNSLRTELLSTKQIISKLQLEKEEKVLESIIIGKKYQEEIEKLKMNSHVLEVKLENLKTELKKITDERNQLKSKVNVDIQSIGRREKELLNQLEMLKEDAQSQIDHRDRKIIELRGLLETMEFERQSMLEFNQDEKKLRIQIEEKFDQLKNEIKKLTFKLDY